MNYIKTFSFFAILYIILIFFGIFIHSVLKLTPEIGLNIVALIASTLVVIKLKYINFFESKLQLLFSIFGGGYTIITAYLLAVIFNSFTHPTINEGVVLFVFNTLVIYLTIQVVIKKT
ncbi:hypothetical protein V6248_13700 [Pseudoalteromonas agarivorans]|uniref:hypothetical protein n=1 Tax=Pseudoalteromonas agarivorans TaxID=176102 RepID=UPI00311F7644